MENASKALIIAGAILLSILIISLGLIVVQNTRRVVDNANVNQQEVQTFNEPFEAYNRSGLTTMDVRGLFSRVMSNNGAQTQNGTLHYIKNNKAAITKQIDAPAGNSADVTSIVIPTTLVNGHTYTVTLGYDSAGFVTAFAVYDENDGKYIGAAPTTTPSGSGEGSGT